MNAISRQSMKALNEIRKLAGLINESRGVGTAGMKRRMHFLYASLERLLTEIDNIRLRGRASPKFNRHKLSQ